MRIDHVLWKTGDLDAAVARFAREHGLHATGGGRHVGQGTHNRVVPLGGGYVELIAVADADEAAASPFGAAIAAAPDGWMGWAVVVEDAAAHAARLGLALSTIERQGLRASLAGVAEALATPTLPFFLQRDHAIGDPGDGGGAGGIAGIEVAGDPTALHQWLGEAAGTIPVTVEAGAPAVLALRLGSGAVIR